MWPSRHDPCPSPLRRPALPWMLHNCLQVTCADFKTTLTGAETRQLGKEDRVWTQKRAMIFSPMVFSEGWPLVENVGCPTWARLQWQHEQRYPVLPMLAMFTCPCWQCFSAFSQGHRDTLTPSLDTGRKAHEWVQTKTIHNEDVLLVEFMYLVFTCMPRESYCRLFRSLLLYLCYVFWVLINSLGCWSWMSALGLVPFQIQNQPVLWVSQDPNPQARQVNWQLFCKVDGLALYLPLYDMAQEVLWPGV